MASDQRADSPLSLKTLLLAAASSAVAAVVVPMLWRPGTVFAAAMTPIIVTLVTEALKRPVETVTSVRVRRTPGGSVVRERTEQEFDPLAPPTEEDLEALVRQAPGPPPRRVERQRRRLTGRQWRFAIVTGLLAFGIAAAVVTFTELAAGDAVSGGDARTTLFGGSTKKAKATPTPTATPEESATPPAEESPTPTPTPTATESPSTEATPAPTETPAPGATPAQTPTPAPTP